MFIVGLTGSLSSGKTSVATLLARKGARVLNADKIAHKLISNRGTVFKKIVKIFSREILTKGIINRRKLADIVFGDDKKIKILEKIIHPAVKKEIIKQIKTLENFKKNKIVVLDVPLLFETGYDRICDATVVVSSNQNQQIKRASKALNISKADTLRRIQRQMPLVDKRKKADFIIDNRGTKKNLESKVNKLWQELVQRIKKEK